MNETVARNIIEIARSIDPIIGKLYDEVAQIDDVDLRAKFDRSVGDLMGLVAREFIFPVEKIYPTLAKED